MKKEILLLSILVSVSILTYVFIPTFDSEKESLNRELITERKLEKNIPFENNVELTFDIVRLNPDGNAIIAGKTIPNSEVLIFDGNDKLATVLSDSNGDWVWMSESPLSPGLKRFNLKSFVDEDVFVSAENVIILREKKDNLESRIIKFKDSTGIEILNNSEIESGLSLDIVEFNDKNSLIISGRTKPNNKVKIFLSNEFKINTTSDKLGNWSAKILNLNFKDYDLSVTTNIQNQKIKLKTKIFHERINPKIFLEKEIVVQNGNSLWRIARKTLGGGIFYSEIYKNNINKIKNPDLIYPGQVFNIPNLEN
tara:strand:+ start:553 stop:1482 length:930 start_codon:yes stop_codon:yes gene_type:complete